MALMTILVILISLSGLAAAETCGTSGRSCSDRATCNQTTSRCHCNKPYTWGDGFFQCYKPDRIAAEAKNDVHITTFNNETVEFPFPCRYLFTEVQHMYRRDSEGKHHGMCQFTIYAFNKRFRGKIVTHGYDITIYSGKAIGTPLTGKSVRVYGTAANMVKNITIMEADMDEYGFETNRVWSDSDQIDGSLIKFGDRRVKLEYTEDDYKSVFKVEACGGLEITFIPYDTELRRSQKHIPGLSVSFKERDNRVKFEMIKTIALGTNPILYLNDIKYHWLNVGQSLVRRAMLHGEQIQTQPDADDMAKECTYSADSIEECDKQGVTYAAFTNCYWMLEEPRFIRCLSDHGYNHLDFFQTCIDSVCYEHQIGFTGWCQDLMETVEEICNLRDISKVDEFLNGDLCPREPIIP